jgi:hypothetical protein
MLLDAISKIAKSLRSPAERGEPRWLSAESSDWTPLTRPSAVGHYSDTNGETNKAQREKKTRDEKKMNLDGRRR